MLISETSINAPIKLGATISDVQVTLAGAAIYGSITSGFLRLRGRCGRLWCKSSYGLPPYNDPYLRLVLDMFDDEGRMVGTGYRDMISESEENPVALETVVIHERVDPQLSPLSILYYLLIEPTGKANEYKRIGIGHTIDRTAGMIFGTESFEKWESREIVMV